MGRTATADDFFAEDLCGIVNVELDTRAAIDAAYCAISPRRKLLLHSLQSKLAAYRALAECREEGCAWHGDRDDAFEARQWLVQSLGEHARE